MLLSEVDFTTMLTHIFYSRTSFTRVDLKSKKITDDLTGFFALLGSRCVNASRKMLMKLTPDECIFEHLSIFFTFAIKNKF